MSQHARNGGLRHSGPQECGLVRLGVTVRPLIAALFCSNPTNAMPPLPCAPSPQHLAGAPFIPRLLLEVKSGAASPRRQRERRSADPSGAVWSSGEASNFHRCLDDEAREAPGCGPSYKFGLCSPADFAVSVKRLLGHHQSQSS